MFTIYNNKYNVLCLNIKNKYAVTKYETKQREVISNYSFKK